MVTVHESRRRGEKMFAWVEMTTRVVRWRSWRMSSSILSMKAVVAAMG